MSYHHQSDPQQTSHDGGVEETEVYQPTAEWEAMPDQEPWAQGLSDDHWDEQSDDVWHDDEHDEWEHEAAHESYEDDEAAGGATGAKQTLSVAADKITRWFAGLDRRPEYEEHFSGSDPVAEVEPEPEHGDAFPTRPAGAAGGRRAAAERAIAANRRRSIAASRDESKGGSPFARGPAHAKRALRGARDRAVVPEPVEADDVTDEPLPELMGGEGSARFAVAPLGYNRQAVDEHVAGLEQELSELRESGPAAPVVEPPMSVQEELERIGEQTASILVVAHDKANETTRLAQEQAERCVSDAAANAVAITDEAKRKLRALEAETDGVRRRRERLIADARNVAASLVSLADEAERRFPADEPSQQRESVAAAVASEPAPADTEAQQPVADSAPGPQWSK